MTPIYVFLVQALTAWLCYVFGKFACKIYIQGFSFAFPVNLTIPLTVSLLVTACGLKFEKVCAFDFMPAYLFWECKNGDILSNFISKDHAWVWIFWLLSQTWITLHIWYPKCERLASTEKLFVSPMYNSLLIDQSLALNRRKHDEGELKADDLDFNRNEANKDMSQYYETTSIHSEASNLQISKAKSSDFITRIYAVATMWHETEDEMMLMLKSILRMDEDQCARRVAQKYLKVIDPDYYEFETHIFFDDAFEVATENEDENVSNSFVKLFVSLVDKAASHVHGIDITVRPPKKFPTPYGGRLVWTLPGKTKIIVHLKDKSKIRHKKRWSQVMYMYYLLGFKLMDQPISIDRKDVIAENTYLLALDGDIDFAPTAVALLVDLMRKNHNLGAACGRIHPVGGGLMVWYQMFEYAVGHWLQKATEHVIGCVLCSPGCFSLFRGKALMDDNVMKTYTTISSQARHYVQYDQGEDRWLCTLLLQRGYRVEYSAASDAYTHAPEGFGEFYNQRRRWVPSTMANIMDLLQEYKRTVQINDNISMPYILYQLMVMIGTILGPGTIFLMLVGAFLAAFGLSNWDAFVINVIPILIFMLICFTLKSNVQISIAYFLSAVYVLVMIVVLVGMMLQFAVEGWASPSSIFFLASAGSFIITGLLHPKEILCLPCGMIYYLLVPSMYLLLQIYSCYNLNNVSWGTREVAQKARKKTREEIEREKKEAEEAKKQKKKEGFLSFLHRDTSKDEDEGSFEFSCAGLFKMMCCTHPKPNIQQQQLASIAESLDILKRRFEGIENHMGISPSDRRRSTIKPRQSLRAGGTITIVEDEDYSDNESENSEPKEERDDLVNPYWMEDKDLKRGEVDYLPNAEVQFFKDLIEKYLFPINKDKEAQKKAEIELLELRNKAVFSFSMMNAIFVTGIFLLQQHKDTIHIDWPLGYTTNITFEPDTNEVLISMEKLQLEPIGLVFVVFFALILAIQFSAMLIHRFGTISHILASTDITFCTKKAEDVSEDKYIEKHAVNIVKELQRLKDINENDAIENSNERLGRRMTIHNLAKSSQKKQEIGSLDVAFKKRFFSISAESADMEGDNSILGNMRRLSMRRGTVKALAERRESVVHERRQSRILASRKQTTFAPDVEMV
ncbi:chitin synthase I [Halocaridina rubra]|uniref:chitin synthase n=1 Tax=Halocaridina rubra TaxID=373956 RepID=A0AAN8X900_HALRR